MLNVTSWIECILHAICKILDLFPVIWFLFFIISWFFFFLDRKLVNRQILINWKSILKAVSPASLNKHAWGRLLTVYFLFVLIFWFLVSIFLDFLLYFSKIKMNCLPVKALSSIPIGGKAEQSAPLPWPCWFTIKCGDCRLITRFNFAAPNISFMFYSVLLSLAC